LGLRTSVQGLSFNVFTSYVSSSQRRNFITEIGKVSNSVPVLRGGSEYIAAEANASSFTHIPQWLTLNSNIKYAFLNDKVVFGILLFDILGSWGTYEKIVDNPFQDGAKVGYKGTVKNPRGIVDGRHIEYPRSYLFGRIIGGETMGRKIYGYLKIDF
jgi:hypothetical protein